MFVVNTQPLKFEKIMLNQNENNFHNKISELSNIFSNLVRENSKMVEKNIQLFKILATVKNDLEKCLKNPNNIANSMVNSINILREVTPYYSADAEKNKIDPPLSDEEKESFFQKLKETK